MPYGHVEELSKDHVIEEFDCGSDAQTSWFRESSLQSHLGGMTRVFVACRDDTKQVVGFYALSTGSVVHAEAPERLKKGSGHYDIPVVVLTRLGVDISEHKKGLGKALLVDALRRVHLIAEHAGVKALLIHAEDAGAKNFYLRYAAFDESPTDPLHLTLLMKDLRRAIG